KRLPIIAWKKSPNSEKPIAPYTRLKPYKGPNPKWLSNELFQPRAIAFDNSQSGIRRGKHGAEVACFGRTHNEPFRHIRTGLHHTSRRRREDGRRSGTGRQEIHNRMRRRRNNLRSGKRNTFIGLRRRTRPAALRNGRRFS